MTSRPIKKTPATRLADRFPGIPAQGGWPRPSLRIPKNPDWYGIEANTGWWRPT